MPLTIMTIGYEGASIERFFDELRAHNVSYLIDVRQMPLSRKPGFSKTALSNHAVRHGLNYIHMVDLGCPKEIRRDYQEDGDWVRYSERFLTYLDTQDAVLDDLATLARQQRCALLCYEADPLTCHRSYVARALSERVINSNIVHLTPTAITQAAHLVAV